MQNKTMTVNRALRELKTLEKRIRAASQESFIDGIKCNATVIKGISKSDMAKRVKANYESLKDLLAYRDALKQALVQSNAKTTIILEGKPLTIAEAIFKKSNTEAIDFMIKRMTIDYNSASTKVQAANDAVEKNFQEFIVATYGSKDKVTPEAIEAHRKPFYDNNAYELIDPNGMYDVIHKEKEAFQFIVDELDGLITDSNAITNITVSW